MPNLRPDATTSFQNWKFQDKHVQQELFGGEFISAETTLVCAGPPRLGDMAVAGADQKSALVYPIGVLENVGISQSKQLQRVFEIGSRRSYFIPGRVVGSVTLGRILYHGPSLLKVLYAYYKQTTSPDKGSPFLYKSLDSKLPVSEDLANGGPTVVSVPDPNAMLLDLADIQKELHRVKFSPGFNDFWPSLFSDIFNQPLGLALFFKNALERTYGAVYLEEVYLQGHQMSISSGSVLIMEGVSAQFDLARPIDVSAS